jgi:tRNA nucleotidyltransferase (CCA-adding enzyme)
LGLEPKDWDITTSARPEEIMNLFPKTIPTGLKHGTVTIVTESENVEVTTFRIDSAYSDSRHPDQVIFTPNLYEDLSRRDFTMNAIAYSPSKGFIDYFNGIDSMNNRVIHCVGNSHKRFSEDALRMMRAIRFSATLGFKLDDEIINAINGNHHLLSKVSIERIRDEFIKTVVSEHPEQIILFFKTKLLEGFLPELANLPEKIQDDIYKRLSNIPKDRLKARLALLLSKTDDMAVPDILRRMRFDNTITKSVCQIVKCIHLSPSEDAEVRRIASNIGLENLSDLILVWDASDLLGNSELKMIKSCLNNIINNNNCISIADLALDGDVLMTYGITDGKKIGTILRFLLEKVLIDPDLNNKEKLLTIVKQNF